MKVYHGSFTAVEQPDVAYSRKNLDFGRGFYVTTLRPQAVNWALRKVMRRGGCPIVSEYELDDDLAAYKILTFATDGDWVEFVCSCRRGGERGQSYDIIRGGVANDKVYTVVDMYLNGIWDMKRTLEELKYYDANDQMCLSTQRVIDDALRFVCASEVCP
ncbi:MAG: DUF3990 domain-containing protein [Verrucomicrobiota bacterium]|jgi:hypothetical protein|nr:DUF3990 domain-containing protein [Verrucomicrobiota bacterium]